jgi:hypothetical protein
VTILVKTIMNFEFHKRGGGGGNSLTSCMWLLASQGLRSMELITKEWKYDCIRHF